MVLVSGFALACLLARVGDGMMDEGFGLNVMSVVRAIIATILATTMGIVVILAELDEATFDDSTTQAAASTGTDVEGEDVAEVIDASTFFNFDSTFLLLSVAIIILVVPDAIAYFRHKKKPEED